MPHPFCACSSTTYYAIPLGATTPLEPFLSILSSVGLSLNVYFGRFCSLLSLGISPITDSPNKYDSKSSTCRRLDIYISTPIAPPGRPGPMSISPSFLTLHSYSICLDSVLSPYSSELPFSCLSLNIFAAPVSITPYSTQSAFMSSLKRRGSERPLTVFVMCLCNPSSPSSCTACPFPILLRLSRIRNS